MGRLKKYKTKEELQEARKKWARDYYLKNAEKIKKRRMEKYYEEVGKKS
jgi:hypothetical protein|tara:strand:+ start:1020 stop:1166 length:147 start_codon:yes stop_codon:yes gene_type:complete